MALNDFLTFNAIASLKNMFIIGAQFHKQSGPDAIQTYHLEFAIDETQRNGVLDLAKSLKKGSEVLLLIFDMSKEESEVKELVNESPEETRTRLNRRMHAMISEIAKARNRTSEEIKKSLKEFLISKKYIKQSTKELTIEGLASAIYYLKNEYESK